MRRTRWARDRGATLPILAVALPVLILMTAFAVDLGRQRVDRRTMQARADVISLDLLRLDDGRTENQIMAGDGTHLSQAAALAQSGQRNDVDPAKITLVDWGTFVSGRTPEFIPTSGTDVPDAVRVTAEDDTQYFFRLGSGHVSRTALATQQKKACFSIGSFAASLSSGSGTLLNTMLGDALNLGVLSYNGLATVDLTYAQIAAELGLADPEELFDGDVSVLDAMEASAAIIQRNNPSSAELVVLNQVIGASNSNLDDVAVGDVIRVTTGSEDAALGSTVNLLDLLATGAFIANGTSALAIPTINLGVPGFNLTGALNHLIQAARTGCGPTGAQVPTSQAAGTLGSTTSTLALGSYVTNTLNGVVPGICGILLLGALACGITQTAVTAEITVSAGVDLASALGTIANIDCPGPPQRLDIDVDSQLLTVTTGLSVKLKAGARELLTVPLSVINARPGQNNAAADFTLPPDTFNTFKSSSPAVGSLTGNTTISGLGALGSLLTPALNTLLNNVLTNLNTQLVTPLAAMLGARVASADVAARSIDCRTAALVG